MTLSYYLDSANKWRWHLIAGNHLIVADSGQGYASKAHARRAWRRIEALITGGGVVEEA